MNGEEDLIGAWPASRSPINRERMHMTVLVTIAIVATLSQAPAPPAHGTTSTPPAQVQQTPEGIDALQLQVMLDRAGLSPGAIDGKMGANTRKALALFNSSGRQSSLVPATTTYRITAE